MFPIQIGHYCDNLSKVVGPPFLIQIIEFCGNLSKFDGQNLPTPLPSSILLCCIDLEITPSWRLKKGGWSKAFMQIE